MNPPPPLPGAAGLWHLDPKISHLNNGSFGGTPTSVTEHQAVVRARIDADRDEFFRGWGLAALDEQRLDAAAFCHADPDGFVLVPNASSGVTAVVRSLRLHPGDEILITNHTYSAVVHAATELARTSGASLVVAAVPMSADDEVLTNAVLSAVTERTKFALIDHVTSSTAMILPAQQIVSALHDRGVAVLVDAAHAPGMVDVDLQGLSADFWVANFHKWAMSGLSAAGLYVGEKWRDQVRSTVISVDDDKDLPTRFIYQGTQDYSSLLTVTAGFDVLRQLGEHAVRQHNHDLADYGRHRVSAALGTQSELPVTNFGSMAIVPLPAASVRSKAEALALQHRIRADLATQVAVVWWNERGYIRLSAQAYNGAGEYEALAAGLGSLGLW